MQVSPSVRVTTPAYRPPASRTAFPGAVSGQAQRETADAPGHDPRRGDACDAPPAADKLPQGGVLGQRVGRLRQLLMQREIFLLQGVQPGHVVPADNAVYPSQRGGPECRQLRQGQQKRGQHQRHGPAPTPPAAARKIQLHKHHPKAEYALRDGVRLWYNTERIQRM